MNIHASENVIQALRELLVEGKISTQDELAQALRDRGLELSQSKISRLLNKVGAIKVNNTAGESCYRLPHEYHLAHEMAESQAGAFYSELVINIASNESVILIRTIPSAASLVARLLDYRSVELNLLGTLAGDDTVLVIPKSHALIPEILASIKLLLN